MLKFDVKKESVQTSALKAPTKQKVLTKEQVSFQNSLFLSLASEGEALVRKENYSKAEVCFRKALAIKQKLIANDIGVISTFDRDRVNCLILRSHCRLSSGDAAGGLEDAERALLECSFSQTTATNYACALLARAEALYYSGDFEKALLDFHKGERERPEISQFKAGVQKSEEAISQAILEIDAGRIKEKRKIGLQKEEEKKKLLTSSQTKPSRQQHHPPSIQSFLNSKKKSSARNSTVHPHQTISKTVNSNPSSPNNSNAISASNHLHSAREEKLSIINEVSQHLLINPQESNQQYYQLEQQLQQPKHGHFSSVQKKSESKKKFLVGNQPVINTYKKKEPIDILEKVLLEEIFDDKIFLLELTQDSCFMKCGKEQIGKLVYNAIDYLNTRIEFWRQRNPTASATTGKGRPQSSKSIIKKVIPSRQSSAMSNRRPMTAKSCGLEYTQKLISKAPTKPLLAWGSDLTSSQQSLVKNEQNLKKIREENNKKLEMLKNLQLPKKSNSKVEFNFDEKLSMEKRFEKVQKIYKTVHT
ncbi:Tetratricopeptide repeat protein 25 [Clydaea vesicula]|uniref:Outer dynein arm-docking complex subunit 4 n=1 Tax=Clydaea vesicula TaxID=447962 RepID=A0AAD5XX50_9FUNG|nr:Tetratricopeptide repeat protein 25 [Clydaea vesicula]